MSAVDWKIEPAASSPCFSTVALTMFPLWARAMGPRWHSIRIGCALAATVSPAVE